MIVELTELIEKLESGSRPKGGVKNGTTGIPSLGAEHLDSEGSFTFKKIKFVPDEFFRNQKKGLIKKNDILIVKDGATTGKVSFVSETFPYKEASINEHVFKVSLNKNRAIPKYVFWHLFSQIGQSQILKDFRGATVGGISRGFTKNIKFPLPSLEEQKRIVRILDQADTLRQKRQKAISLLDDYLKAVFLEMFGASSKNFNKWEELEIQNLTEKKRGSMRTGPFGSNLRHSEFVNKGIAVIGIDNAVKNKFQWAKRRYITEDKYQKLKQYTVFPGDVIITIMGTTGRSAVIPENIPLAINTKHIAAITVDRQLANPYFLSYSIHANPYIIRQIEDRNRGAIMNGLNLGIIKKIKLRKPPIKMQNKFEQIYHEVESLKEKMQTQAGELETQFQASMQKAFSPYN